MPVNIIKLSNHYYNQVNYWNLFNVGVYFMFFIFLQDSDRIKLLRCFLQSLLYKLYIKNIKRKHNKLKKTQNKKIVENMIISRQLMSIK